MKAAILHLAVLAVLLALNYLAPPYHHTMLARIMVLAVFGLGYNIAYGYTGLLSLGHALYFAAGLYASGLLYTHAGWGPGPAMLAGVAAGGAIALATGVLALRTSGVSFMIVTLMFAQAGYQTILYFTPVTRGEEGFTLPEAGRVLGQLKLTDDATRYLMALALFAIALIIKHVLVRSARGRVMVAMRENEERSRLLGYDPFRVKLVALVTSGVYAGAAGAAWGLLFGYVGAGFAGIQYSILPLLYTLLGGAGTVLGPFLGTVVMFYLIDLTSDVTQSYLFMVGACLLVLIVFAPRGILGTLRKRGLGWLP